MAALEKPERALGVRQGSSKLYTRVGASGKGNACNDFEVGIYDKGKVRMPGTGTWGVVREDSGYRSRRMG